MIDALLQLNWVDIIVVILIIRVGYISIKSGFPVEIFKLLGTICAIYLSLHYYISLGNLLRGYFTSMIPENYFNFICFIALTLLGYFLFFLFRTALYHFVDVKAVPALSKWGGLVTGFLRDILLIGLIIFAFSISSVTYLANSANKSYIASRFSQVAPSTYSWIWNNITSKFIPSEKFNNAVLEDK